jgi:serine protease inhibitor
MTTSQAALINNEQLQASSGNASGYTLRTANRLYFDGEEPIRACMKGIFPSEIEQVDFRGRSAELTSEINGWVSNVTEGKINDLIPEGVLTKETRLAIVNSAYFKGKWLQQFKKSRTKLDLFYAAEDEVVPTMMMVNKGLFRRGGFSSVVAMGMFFKINFLRNLILYKLSGCHSSCWLPWFYKMMIVSNYPKMLITLDLQESLSSCVRTFVSYRTREEWCRCIFCCRPSRRTLWMRR